ncbi:MAG: amylo-alpha-1,6-glucosidase [Calditrichia bacterium]
MKAVILTETLKNFDEAVRLEWLETNGLGGWASSTITGAQTRRYHGLLVAALDPPVSRKVLLSKLDETLILNDKRIQLGSNRYPGVVHPTGYTYLERFEKEVFPVFYYRIGDVFIRKTIVALHNENTTVILYEILESSGKFELELQPFIAFRDYHSLAKENSQINPGVLLQDQGICIKPYQDMPELYLQCAPAVWQSQPLWYRNVEYDMERYRGLDFHEDLFSHGCFKLTAEEDGKIAVIVSTANPSERNGFALVEKELARRVRLLHKSPCQHTAFNALALAADQFIVKRGDKRTILAGYPWFTDWGRDTMISLPGLTLSTGRYHDAAQILQTYANSVSEGMLPNRFTDTNKQPEFNTVDASLWFFVAVYKYWQVTKDGTLVGNELFPVLKEIMQHHLAGTRYNIRCDSDGLLAAGEQGVQLTWMDAKVGDQVVTPREGKAVEINALWFNALSILSKLSEQFNDVEVEKYQKLANRAKRSFNKLFWNENDQCLFDYVDGDHRDTKIRPNQIFAISLPFVVLQKNRWKAVLHTVETHLFTPVGLRSLSPEDPKFRDRYVGDAVTRDGMYHQGIVWGWLMGPYLSALIKVNGRRGKKEAKLIIQRMMEELSQACIGSLSEIFDAREPFTARGAFAQAWSVAEILRVLTEDLEEIK